jgi:hypothetical protein
MPKLFQFIKVMKKLTQETVDQSRCFLILTMHLFEKLMYKRLKLFFDKNETFYEKQYGFRAKHSTQHACHC